jgi:cohesin complex subunit SA-1/2
MSTKGEAKWFKAPLTCSFMRTRLSTGLKVGKATKKDAKTNEMVTTDEEEAEINEVEEIMGTTDVAPVSTPARPKPKPRAGRRQLSATESGDDDDLDAFGEQIGPVARVTPKTKPRSRPDRKTKATRPQSATRSPTRSPSLPQISAPNTPKSPLSEPPTTPEPDTEMTPTAKRKRARSSDDDESPASPQVEEDVEVPDASQETHTGELKVRRKRVRH